MPQIRPITELRNTNEISDLCHKTDEPVFVTKNGYGDMVIMSIETYERDIALSSIYRKLASAQHQVESGDTVDAGDVFSELKTKYRYGL
jgi:prevent-host-death family protein